MRKLKFQVNTKEAVRLIRSGAGDTMLMETFHLSAVGLQKLFKKLVEADEIQQSELDRRMLASGRSHVIDLTDDPVTRTRKTLINKDEAVNDVCRGISDIDLMEKYNLSVSGLESLLAKLLDAGKITRLQLDQRKEEHPRGARDRHAPWDGTDSPPEDDPVRGEADTARSISQFVQKHKVLVAAIAGAVAGISIMACLIMVLGLDLTTGVPGRVGTAGVSRTPTDEIFAQQIEEVIAILEAVARGNLDPGKALERSETSALQKCLEDCKNSHRGTDDAEKIDLVACRKDCLSIHSQLFKRIQERYHGSGE